ncbi:MAG: MarC family protein [Gammaproteobacteria bacterium]|nr:MarC family protein [Gammaproteobacteria bacterium]
MLQYAIDTLIILLVVLDPVGVVPIFAALTHGATEDIRRRMAFKGVTIAALILIGFMLTGQYLLGVLNISFNAFRISGGILLLLLAIEMVFARQSGLRSTTLSETQEAVHKPDISVFPLAIPLIAGPGAMTTLLLLLGENTQGLLGIIVLCTILFFVLGGTLLALLTTGALMRILGETGTNVVSRVLGVMLASLAIQYILDGVSGAFFPAVITTAS